MLTLGIDWLVPTLSKYTCNWRERIRAVADSALHISPIAVVLGFFLGPSKCLVSRNVSPAPCLYLSSSGGPTFVVWSTLAMPMIKKRVNLLDLPSVVNKGLVGKEPPPERDMI